jgi:hypothetical protein
VSIQYLHTKVLERVVRISMCPPILLMWSTESLRSSSSTSRSSLAKTRAVRLTVEEGACKREKPMRAMINVCDAP